VNFLDPALACRSPFKGTDVTVCVMADMAGAWMLVVDGAENSLKMVRA
jgi:hypothetical protein